MRVRGGRSPRPPHYRCRFPILPLARRGFNAGKDAAPGLFGLSTTPVGLDLEGGISLTKLRLEELTR